MSATRRLGWLVGTLAAVQIALYGLSMAEQAAAAFYFDPRIGLSFLQSSLGGGSSGPGLVQWMAALWQLGIAFALVTGRARARAYIVEEVVLGGPSVFFFLVVLVSNMSPSHGFSIPELLIPVVVFALFSAVPLWWAFRLDRGTRGGISETAVQQGAEADEAPRWQG